MSTPEELLSFWFGELDEHGHADGEHARRWYMKNEAFDEELRSRFGELHAAVVGGQHEGWLASDRGRLAYVIVLDQLSRNLFRGTGRMFAADARALEVALDGVAAGADRRLRHDERAFLYMPLMHSEEPAVQDRCVELFAAWRDELPPDRRAGVERSLDYAERHRVIVRRFGRFPHRNELLGRTSTPEELAFLAQPGSSF
jgi:uncharacterized protein (DUF924 family)